MSKLIAVAVAALFAVSVNSYAQAPKAPEKAPAVKADKKAAETKGSAKGDVKGEKAAPKAETVKK